ncbi:hypothetical protein K7432_016125 [Basidiobolus ranarum]|uniref:Uncharacterized protein n=1 Tax=Basidiobolus ranarum TaxID=34480 RepID=A0ABR2WF67_9FUNG
MKFLTSANIITAIAVAELVSDITAYPASSVELVTTNTESIISTDQIDAPLEIKEDNASSTDHLSTPRNYATLSKRKDRGCCVM